MVTIARNDLHGDGAVANITNVHHLASYSWIESLTPTIAVPGIPAKWSPPTRIKRLPKDSGLIYISQNAARHPDSPLEPLFRALYMTEPAFEMRSVDLISDRNNLRKLLSFVDSSSSQKGLERFTIDVEVTGGTVIFSRTETQTTEIIAPHEFKGFGHEFEKAYTTCAIDDSTGHHRIVSYCLGGMRLMVRYEVDGYVDEDCTLPAHNKTMEGEVDLSALLGNMSLSTTHDLIPVKAATKLPGSKLTIRQEGKEVPIESTLEIKTRVAHKPLSITDVASQLWLSQTPKLVRAYHRKGMFERPQVEDVTMELKDWKRSHQIVLNKFVFLLEKILKVAKGIDGRAVVEYNPTADSMVVRPVEGKPMLPEDLYEKWRHSDLEESAQSEETIEQQRDD
ncbi:hypothetical protein PG988_006542 [Apiospora saccharicola]